MTSVCFLRSLAPALLFSIVSTAAFGQSGLEPQSSQPAARAITPVPYNDHAPVALKISVGQDQLRIGSIITICFEASRAGFATLWNLSTTGAVTRIFPNSYSTVSGGGGADVMHIEGEHSVCAGSTGDPFRYRVDGPPGMEDLYMLWTARADLQPAAAAYPDLPSLANEMHRLGGASPDDWAAGKISYDIVPAGGPVPPQLPPVNGSGSLSQQAPSQMPPSQAAAPQAAAPQTSAPDTSAPETSAADSRPPPRIFILAAGANVQGLTKANQDAAVFVLTMHDLFNVKDENIQFLKDATKAQIAEGFSWLEKNTQPRDFVFVFFSGHGGHQKGLTGTSADGYDEFLVPYDLADPKNADVDHVILGQELDAWINQLPSNHVISVIDACHSGGVYRSMEGELVGARKKFLNIQLKNTGSALQGKQFTGSGRVMAKGLLLAAAKREESALELSNGSAFTMALVGEMRASKSGTLADIFQRASSDIHQALQNSGATQTPVEVGDVGLANLIDFSPK